MSVQSPGQEDPLEERMATHASILAWRISWTEEPDGPQSTHACMLSCFNCIRLFETPWTMLPARFLCPWDSPGKNTGVDCLFLLQGIFQIQGPNLCLLHWQVDS